MNNKRIPLPEFILIMCVALSIALSSYIFLIVGNKPLGTFIGLWAPTIMGLVNYINIKFKK